MRKTVKERKPANTPSPQQKQGNLHNQGPADISMSSEQESDQGHGNYKREDTPLRTIVMQTKQQREHTSREREKTEADNRQISKQKNRPTKKENTHLRRKSRHQEKRQATSPESKHRSSRRKSPPPSPPRRQSPSTSLDQRKKNQRQHQDHTNPEGNHHHHPMEHQPEKGQHPPNTNPKSITTPQHAEEYSSRTKTWIFHIPKWPLPSKYTNAPAETRKHAQPRPSRHLHELGPGIGPGSWELWKRRHPSAHHSHAHQILRLKE